MNHIPVSTYRIQFNPKFKFSDAVKYISYLKELGISDLYASPVFKARKNSAHGYDVTDPNLFNPELGSESDFEILISTCKRNNINWLQDIVPNHMAFNYENQMLIDLLENGNNSRCYNYFDIEWDHPFASSKQRLLAPFLGKFYQEALEAGEIKLRYDENGFSITYYDTRLPLSMESYSDVLAYRLDKLRNKLGINNPEFIRYQGVLYVLKSLPTADDIDERYLQIKFVKGILWELYQSNHAIKDFIDETVKIFNSERENTGNYDLLDKLLSEQHFRLSYWKVANEEINYRRFFNINELISLRVEDEETFNRTHSLILRMVKEGKFKGLRVDHVDGLYDPKEYLERLRERAKDCFIVVEKILDYGECLPEDWPVQGTTGYDFMNFVNGLFCKMKNERKMNSVYTKFTHIDTPFEQIYLSKKRMIIEKRMAGDVERLAFIVERISSNDRYGIDITMHGLKQALEEILTHFPIYRTYVRKGIFSENDKKYISEVIEKVKYQNPRLKKEFEYIGNLLLQKYSFNFSEEQKRNALDFIMRFQQLTGPIMAKGFEDTTLYIYNRFISLNEVGGSPAKFGINKPEFYDFCKKRKRKWPHTMNATSTHDTKRGEDVRARINVLSEIPDEWESKVKKWNKINKIYKTNVAGKNAPVKNDEYFLYQTMIGCYPFYDDEHDSFVARLKEYSIKAAREAKIFTRWVSPDADYENALLNFIDKILNRELSKDFFNDFYEFQKRVAFYGMFNSISQAVIKITAPGIPDFYQGTEMWDFSMVDPDNRRSVDYELRKKILTEIKKSESNNLSKYISDILKNYHDSRIKILTVYKTLQVRNNFLEVFNDGEMVPLNINGELHNNLIAYARLHNDEAVVVVLPRFLTELVKENEFPFGKKIWGATSVQFPEGFSKWKNIFTGETLNMKTQLHAGEIFNSFPAAVLIGQKKS